MQFISKLIDNFRQQVEIPQRLKHIYATLYKLQSEHRLIEVSLEGDRRHYQSMILKLDVAKNQLILDELFPATDFMPGYLGQTIHVTCRDRGMTTRFTSVITHMPNADAAPFYIIDLPADVALDQRRSAFRVTVDESVRLQITVTDKNRLLLPNKVVDISYTGIRVKIDGDRSTYLKSGTVLPNVALQIAENSVSCSIDLRNVAVITEPVQCTIIGGKFDGLSDNDARTLQHFILQRQREMRRKEIEEAFAA
jgi:c-di-GMP-binding flagellar brake protein YcgR